MAQRPATPTRATRAATPPKRTQAEAPAPKKPVAVPDENEKVTEADENVTTTATAPRTPRKSATRELTSTEGLSDRMKQLSQAAKKKGMTTEERLEAEFERRREEARQLRAKNARAVQRLSANKPGKGEAGNEASRSPLSPINS